MKVKNANSFLRYQKDVQKMINQSNDTIINLDRVLYRVVGDYPQVPDGVILISSIRINFNREAIRCFAELLGIPDILDRKTDRKEESCPIIVYAERAKGYLTIRKDNYFDYKMEPREKGYVPITPRVSPGRISLEWNGRYAYGRRFLPDDSLAEFPLMLFIGRRNGRSISRMTFFLGKQITEIICKENNLKTDEQLEGQHLLVALNKEEHEIYLSTKPLKYPEHERREVTLTAPENLNARNIVRMTQSGSFQIKATEVDWPEGIKTSSLRRFEFLECIDEPNTYGLLLQPLNVEEDERSAKKKMLKDKRQIVKQEGLWSLSAAELTQRFLDIKKGKGSNGLSIETGGYPAQFIPIEGDKVLVKFKIDGPRPHTRDSTLTSTRQS